MRAVEEIGDGLPETLRAVSEGYDGSGIADQGGDVAQIERDDRGDHNPDSTVLVIGHSEWTIFLKSIVTGEFHPTLTDR